MSRDTKNRRPRIRVGSGPATIRALTDAINAGRLPQTYVRDGRVVHVEEVSGSAIAAVSGKEDSLLPVEINEVDRHRLAELLARHAYVYRVKTGKDGEDQDEEVTPTTQQLQAALAPKSWNLDWLHGAAGAPLLRPDGTLLQDRGYDKATGLFLASKVPLDRVPEKPSRTQVDAAREFLLERFLRDFPWVDDADRANYVAVLATPILRWYLRTLIPFVVFSATTPGSGKTILTSGPGLLYGQRVLTWPNGQDADTELRKVITSVLADPVGAVVFDNLPEGEVIKSPVLARLITDRQWADRLLGGNATANYANDRLWCATGNNIRLGGDMVTRTVLIELDPNCPHPEERTGFAIPDLEQWILQPANRSCVLWHLLVLIVDWTRNGAPREQVIGMRQFTGWAEALGGFLGHHEIKGFLGNVERVRGIDDEHAMWTAFLAQWHELNGDKWIKATELAASADIPPGQPDPWEGLFPTDRRGRPLNARVLGMRLTGQVGRPRPPYVLRSDLEAHTKTRLWRVEVPPGWDTPS